MGCAEFLENVERSPRDASRSAQDQRPEEGRSTAAPRNRARRRRRVGRGGTCPRCGARGAPEDTRTRSVYGSGRAMDLGHREGGHGDNRHVTSIGGRGRSLGLRRRFGRDEVHSAGFQHVPCVRQHLLHTLRAASAPALSLPSGRRPLSVSPGPVSGGPGSGPGRTLGRPARRPVTHRLRDCAKKCGNSLAAGADAP